MINPNEYQELLNETYFREKISVPILATAFGDVITLEESQYIGLGGSEKVDNLDKVKIREHIEVISEMVGKVGM